MAEKKKLIGGLRDAKEALALSRAVAAGLIEDVVRAEHDLAAMPDTPEKADERQRMTKELNRLRELRDRALRNNEEDEAIIAEMTLIDPDVN